MFFFPNSIAYRSTVEVNLLFQEFFQPLRKRIVQCWLIGWLVFSNLLPQIYFAILHALCCISGTYLKSTEGTQNQASPTTQQATVQIPLPYKWHFCHIYLNIQTSRHQKVNTHSPSSKSVQAIPKAGIKKP